jgi:hypothetical protein
LTVTYAITGLPALYGLVYFKGVITMKEGYRKMTEILSAYLILSLIPNVPYTLSMAARGVCPETWILYACYTLVAFLWVLLVYYTGRPYTSKGNNITLTGRWYFTGFAWGMVQGMHYVSYGVIALTVEARCLVDWEFARQRREDGVAIGYWVGTLSLVVFHGFFMFNWQRVNSWLRGRWAKKRMKAGAQISIMLDSIQYSVGMPYWLHRPDICDECEHCTEIKCQHKKCSADHPKGCECQIISTLSPPANRWLEGKVVATELGVGFTAIANREDEARIEKFVAAALCDSLESIFEQGERQLQCVKASEITYERLSAGSGKSNIEELAEAGKPGFVDFFVSHSWHDDKETKFRRW